MNKKLTYNKEKPMCQSHNRLLTEPRVEQILLIDHEPCNFDENVKFTSSTKMNFATNGSSL